MAIYITKPWYAKSGGDGDIYGAEWTIGSSPAWTRTDAAVGFSDPNPYYSGMSGSPSSPFDNISPWKDLQIVEDASAGTLVEIPKFYYKWTRTSGAMKLQISMSPFSGSHVSPAHADRGDGVGERDYAYVGRYHCDNTTYKSITEVKPKTNIRINAFRNSIHNLGSEIWQWDYATYWTIMMMYLIEYASWNSQVKIGYGCPAYTVSNGGTDNLPYHTGTDKIALTEYGNIQYRNIENLWGLCFDFVDGIYANGADVYCIKNPANFDTTGGTKVGERATSNGYITEWTNPTASGFEYALYPSVTNDNLDGTTYICDRSLYNANATSVYVGGINSDKLKAGAFCICGSLTGQSSSVGSRLMVLPPSRLTA